VSHHSFNVMKTKLHILFLAAMVTLCGCRSPDCGQLDWDNPIDINIFNGFFVTDFKEVEDLTFQVSFENTTDLVVVNAGVEMEVWAEDVLVFEELFIMDSDVLPGSRETELYSLDTQFSSVRAEKYLEIKGMHEHLKVLFKVQSAVGQKLK
jgi:hypothetical protein